MQQVAAREARVEARMAQLVQMDGGSWRSAQHVYAT